MSSRLRFIFVFCFLVLIFSGFFFNPKFNFIGFGAFYPSVIIVVIFGVLGLAGKERMPATLAVVAPLYIACALTLISFAVNFPDADYFLVGAIFIMAVVGSCAFGFFNFFSKIDGQPLLAAVVAVFTLNAVLMIVMFISPKFQLGYLNLLSDEGFSNFGGAENALGSMYRLRMIGITGFATYSAGFAQVIGLFFLPVYYKVVEKKPDLLFLIVSMLLMISALLSARSAVLGIFLWFIFCLIFFRLRFLFIFSCSLIFLIIALVALVALMDVDGADYFTKWIFDLFISGTSSESLAENIQMFDVPFLDSGFFGFSRWFGDLGYDYFRSADVGFIRLILAGGFGVLFFVILHFLLMGLFFFRGNSPAFASALYIFLMIYFFIIMLKGAIFFDFYAFDFLMLLLCWVSRNSGNFSSK